MAMQKELDGSNVRYAHEAMLVLWPGAARQLGLIDRLICWMAPGKLVLAAWAHTRYPSAL